MGVGIDGISFDIEGFDFVVKGIMELEDDVKKVREIKKILRRQATNARTVLKAQAPIIKGGWRTITYHRDKSIKYEPGNLKESIMIFNSKAGKDFPTVFVGAQAISPINSGYYGYFVQYGTKGVKGKGGIKNKNNFVKRADEMTRESNAREATDELMKYIKRKAKRQGFVTWG